MTERLKTRDKVIRMLAEGLSTREIAKRTGTSTQNVNMHRKRIEDTQRRETS